MRKYYELAGKINDCITEINESIKSKRRSNEYKRKSSLAQIKKLSAESNALIEEAKLGKTTNQMTKEEFVTFRDKRAIIQKEMKQATLLPEREIKNFRKILETYIKTIVKKVVIKYDMRYDYIIKLMGILNEEKA